MANWGRGHIDGQRFTKASYLGFWTAPQPWGPWKQVHEESPWFTESPNDHGARGYQPQICPKWISEDGREFDLVWTDMRDGGLKGRYAFNTQKVRVTLSTDSTAT